MSTAYCANHSKEITRRKCYRCGKPICKRCVFKAGHHFFCSRKCYILFFIPHQLDKIRRRAMKFAYEASYILRYILRRLTSVPTLLNVLFILTLLAVFGLGLRKFDRLEFQLQELRREVKGLKQKHNPGHASGLNGLSRDVDAKVAKFKIISPSNHAIIQKNLATIIGQAPEDYIIVLTRDGRPIRTTLPQKQVFRFDNVEAKLGNNEFIVRAFDPAGRVNIIEKVSFIYKSPEVAYRSRDFTRGGRDVKRIALTFDGSELDNAAREILTILRNNQINCTMFLTGQFIRRYPETTKQIIAEGHEVGNHTWNHPHLTTFAQNHRQDSLPGVTRKMLQGQLQKTANLFYQITGHQMVPFWRAPYGEHNLALRRWAAELGYRHVGWTIGHSREESLDTMDWVADRNSSVYRSGDEIIQHLLQIADQDGGFGAAGGIILMHLGTLRKNDQGYKILPKFIGEMRLRGYQFVKVSELLQNFNY